MSLNKPHSRLIESGVELRLREMGKKLGVEKVHPHKFFALNGIELRYTQKELYEMVLSVADGSLEYEDMLRWVLEHQA